MSAPRPYATDLERLKEFAHAHLPNIIKGTRLYLFKHKQSKINRKLYLLVFFCPNKKHDNFLKVQFRPFSSPGPSFRLVSA